MQFVLLAGFVVALRLHQLLLGLARQLRPGAGVCSPLIAAEALYPRLDQTKGGWLCKKRQ
jgi:hypothetical protein